MVTAESDEWVMVRLAEGDASALADLMARWGGRLWRYIDRLAGSLRATDDLYQEVWTRLYLYRRRYILYAPFAPYLFSIATRCCFSAMKQRRRERAMPTAWEADLMGVPANDPPPAEALAAKEERGLLYRAIDRLPRRQRAVVLMYCLVTTDYGQIAYSLGRSAATVRSHMHAALKNLRGILEHMTQRGAAAMPETQTLSPPGRGEGEGRG